MQKLMWFLILSTFEMWFQRVVNGLQRQISQVENSLSKLNVKTDLCTWGRSGTFSLYFWDLKIIVGSLFKNGKTWQLWCQKGTKAAIWETRWYQQSYQKSDFPEVKSNPIFMMRHQIEANTLAYDMHICLYWWNECMGAQLDRKVPDFSLTRRKQHRIQTVS